ncbi:DNA-directed RNA polymerase [archaeon]|nr:DNA-directed RNA polymerase [archaeon]MBT6956477.1 DNA-directed RNA polymerase [archaeon]MBT7128470.1 DNA-directed RNA polymerase [archaeon]
MENRRFDNRNNNSGGRGNFGGRNNFNNGPQEKHKAICTACKKECEVPFKPTEGRDVFCQDCFKKNNPRN